ncbi:MAG: hypothetical protein K0Q72_2701 [Armatimonadetes bacterium]|jgi:uncharacterized protein YlxP (DUF503 family)|nr:hypothetical protein [Armatimonadota bacterium]
MAIVVGLVTLDLLIPEANSLKDKRSVVKSMLEGMRNKFNVSAAEVENLDIWRRATVAIACVSNSQTFTDQVLNKVLDWVESNPRVNVTNVEMEFL